MPNHVDGKCAECIRVARLDFDKAEKRIEILMDLVREQIDIEEKALDTIKANRGDHE